MSNSDGGNNPLFINAVLAVIVNIIYMKKCTVFIISSLRDLPCMYIFLTMKISMFR